MKKKSYLVIGLGRFGYNLCKELSKNTNQILAIDIVDENVQEVANFVHNCLNCDSTKKANLENIGASQIDHAIVTISNNIQASILTTIHLKQLGVKEITVRVDDVEYRELFKTLGATNVIIPEESAAISLANRIISDTFLDYYNISDNYSIVKIKIGKDFEAKSLVDLKVRQKFEISIVAIIREKMFFVPQGSDIIKPGDILLVGGHKSKILKFDDFTNR